MLSQSEIEAAALSLDAAERTRQQIGLLSIAHPTITLDDAYAIQRAWVAQKMAAGRLVKSFERSGTKGEPAPPFRGVLHRPTPRSSRRNYGGERKAGCWRFKPRHQRPGQTTLRVWISASTAVSTSKFGAL